MDAPLTQGFVALQLEAYDRSDVSGAELLPHAIVAASVTPTSGQETYAFQNLPFTRLPNELMLLLSYLLDWRDSIRLGSTCVVVQDALKVQHALYSQVASMADAIHQLQGKAWIRQIPTVLSKIDALPWATKPSALQLFVQRIAQRQCGYDVAFGEGRGYVAETLGVWQLLIPTHDEGPFELAARVHWTKIEAAIKGHVQVVLSGSLRHAAMRQLCLAKVYLPWLGLVPDPRKHLGDILTDVATLPYSEWCGILSVLRPLIGLPLFSRLSEAFDDFSIRVREVYSPIPRLLLVDLLSHLTKVGLPGLARCALHERFAVSAAQDLEGVVGAVAQNIVSTSLAIHRSPSVDQGQPLPSTALLRCLNGWDSGDEILAKQVNRCFIRGIAALPLPLSIAWTSLPVAIRRHREGKVLGVAPDTLEKWGCSPAIMSQFWPVFLDITGVPGFIPTAALWEKVMAAPWQLQGVLLHEVWKRYVRRSMELDSDVAVRMSALCIDWESELSAQAFAVAQPALAMHGILASVQWQATCARERCDDWTSHEQWDVDSGLPIYPTISPLGMHAIEATSPADRMALVGVLFSMRRSLIDAGYQWRFDALMFNTLRDFLCDPTTSLQKPSSKLVHAIADVIAKIWASIPDVGNARISRFDRLAARLDLNLDAREHVWSRVLMHLVLRIKSKDRTFDETIQQGDVSTPEERRMLLHQLTRGAN
jgi:hypothetical protein